MSEAASIAFPQKPASSIFDLVRFYLASRQRKLATRTFRRRVQVLSLFSAEFGDRDPLDIFPSEVDEWLHANPKWKDKGGRWSIGTILKALFNWAVREHRIPYSPLAELEIEAGDTRRATTRDEWQAMMRQADQHFRFVLVFMRFAGCRPQDVRVIDWAWLDWEFPKIVIPAEFHKTGKRTGRDRTVYLLEPAVKLLRWLNRSRKEGKVFRNSRGKPWTESALGKRLTGTRKAAGLSEEATCHGLRHAFACEWISRGGSVKLLAEWLGHTSTQTVEKFYIHSSALGPSVLREAQRVMR